MVGYVLEGVEADMSFLEMLDVLNDQLVKNENFIRPIGADCNRSSHSIYF